VAVLLENFDTPHLNAIAEFLARTTDLIYSHAALLRAQTLSAAPGVAEERSPQP
jgi:hypothetical protein